MSEIILKGHKMLPKKFPYCAVRKAVNVIKFLSIWTDGSGQTVQSPIRQLMQSILIRVYIFNHREALGSVKIIKRLDKMSQSVRGLRKCHNHRDAPGSATFIEIPRKVPPGSFTIIVSPRKFHNHREAPGSVT